MRKGFIVALSVAAGIVVGCAVASSPLIVPPVRAGTTPQKWEYICFDIPSSFGEITRELNKLGSQGWEVFAVFKGSCAKRPLP